MPPAQHHRWNFQTDTAHPTTIMPDGCRDLLVVTGRDGAPRLELTDWDLRPRHATLAAGISITGYRLRPGATINTATLSECGASGGRPQDLLGDTDTDVADIVAILSGPGGSLAHAASAAGVGPRTLQRRFRTLGYPPPGFWQLLGRARRAAGALCNGATLADIAHDSGYSDQPHMTRAFVYWFGQSPARIAGDAALLAELRQPGLGNWTGEQISIR